MAKASSSYRAVRGHSPWLFFNRIYPHQSASAHRARRKTAAVPATDRRPYLIAVPPRRPAASARQTATSARQYLSLFPHESEDARLTGATRSLYRRLLALNLPGPSVRSESRQNSVTSLKCDFRTRIPRSHDGDGFSRSGLKEPYQSTESFRPCPQSKVFFYSG